MKRPAAKDPKPRMLRLLALSRHGEPGERNAASRALDRLLDQYGMTVGELDDDETSLCWFRIRTKLERPLIMNIVGMVTGVSEIRSYSEGRSKTRIGYDLTASQEASVAHLFDHYRRVLDRDLDVFVEAFIVRNRIFPEVLKEREHRLTADEMARIRQSLRMMGGVTVSSPLRAITKGGNS